MRTFNKIRKSINYVISLSLVICLFSDFSFACQSVICDNGIQTNICSIGINEIDADWYFNYSIFVFGISLAVKLFSKSRNWLFTVVSLIAVFAAPVLRFLQGGESCNFAATELAKWLFLASIIVLCFQIYTNVILILKNKKNLS